MDSDLLELKELLKYLVAHNAQHADEIAGLAGSAESLGKAQAYQHLMKGVELLHEVNANLAAALAALEA